MRLYIEKKDLEHLLENKSEYIGNKITWDTIFAAISFLLSALTANYDSFFMVPSIIIKYFFIIQIKKESELSSLFIITSITFMI